MKLIKSNRKFLVGFTVYSFGVLLLSLFVEFLLPSFAISIVWPLILLFLYLFTLGAYFLLANYIGSKLSSFANAFILVNFGRLIIFSIIIVVYSIIRHSDAISFTLTFFGYYLILTSYEIIAIFRLQKK